MSDAFCHARSRVPMDSILSVSAPSVNVLRRTRRIPVHDQRRCTGCRDRTISGGSRGSASLPSPAERLGPVIAAVHRALIRSQCRNENGFSPDAPPRARR